jgi:hypothetical protein
MYISYEDFSDRFPPLKRQAYSIKTISWKWRQRVYKIVMNSANEIKGLMRWLVAEKKLSLMNSIANSKLSF